MIVAELKIYNFRQFESVNNKPGLQISLLMCDKEVIEV